MEKSKNRSLAVAKVHPVIIKIEPESMLAGLSYGNKHADSLLP